MAELEKIKYHIRLINSRLGLIDDKIELYFNSDPIASLVIEKDWSEDDLKKVNDIFHKYGEELQQSKKDVDWVAFQHEICNTLGMVYDDRPIKDIIVAFWESKTWINVCTEYAKANRCSEFHEILGI